MGNCCQSNSKTKNVYVSPTIEKQRRRSSILYHLFGKSPEQIKQRWNIRYFDKLLISYFGLRGPYPNICIRASTEDEYLDPVLAQLRRDVLKELEEDLAPFNLDKKNEMINEWMQRLNNHIAIRWKDSAFKQYTFLTIRSERLMIPSSPFRITGYEDDD